MSDAIAMWRHTKMVVLVALTAALYAALLVPFKPIPLVPGVTELRPANVVPIVCSLLFGPAAAWGAAIGNLVGDFFGTLGPGSVFGFIGNFLLGYLPYRIWRLLARRPDPSVALASLPTFFDVCVIPAAVCALVIAWGVDLLGIVPFKILATVITLNNFVASFALGLVLLPLLYPRAIRWRLVYWEIMPEEELADGPLAWPALVLIVALCAAGTSWAAMLWFGAQELPAWAADIPVRHGATVLGLALILLTALLARWHVAGSRAEEPVRAQEAGAAEGAAGLDVRGVSFVYAGGSRPALQDVSFSQEAGCFRCVMGATGAGKTTLSLALSGVIPWLEPGEFSGSVTVSGLLVSKVPPRTLAGRVGLVPQDFETHLLGSQVESAVAFPLENLGLEPVAILERVTAALHAVGIDHLRERNPSFLSGGEKQRVALASTLALSPDLLVLDEPTTDLDPAGRHQVFQAWERLRESSHTFVVTEIDSDVAAMADVLMVLQEGRVAFDGPPEELLSRPELCARLGVVPTEAAQIAAALGLPPLSEEGELVERLVAAGVEMRDPAEPGPAAEDWPARGERLVVVDDLHAGYGGREVLRDVDLEVCEGEVVALLGRNGSGKTTLAKCLDGLLEATSGRALLAGRDAAQMRRTEVARLAGMVFQNPDHQIMATSVLEELYLGPRLAGLDRAAAREGVEAALAVTGLEDVAHEDPFALPKGVRQMVALAAVLAFRPPVIIFDEPTTGLDGPEQVAMMELLGRLAREGRAVLVITHAVWAAARYASRVVLLSEGRVAADGPPRGVLGEVGRMPETGVEPPVSVRVSQRVLGQTLLAPHEFATHVRLPGLEKEGADR